MQFVRGQFESGQCQNDRRCAHGGMSLLRYGLSIDGRTEVVGIINHRGRMKKFLLLLLVVLLSVGIVANASAQELPYFFHVEKAVVHQYLNSDGTTSRDYT